MQFEYRRIEKQTFVLNENNFTGFVEPHGYYINNFDELQQLGAEGWEAYAVDSHYHYLKRKLDRP